MIRWSALNPNNGGAYCNIFEVCNEPNLYEIPPGVSTPLHFYAGRQIITARQIQLNGLFSPILAAPALGDDARLDTGDFARGCRPFTEALCNYLRSQNFQPDGFWMWTHHNYTDIENSVNNGTTTLAQAVRTRISANGFWTGYPNVNASDPYIYQTEGGSRAGQGLSTQASTLAKNYAQCHNDSSGRGIGMYTNYLDVTSTDPRFDTGLREAATLAARPVYFTWAGFGTT
jgi:hypothetical protein